MHHAFKSKWQYLNDKGCVHIVVSYGAMVIVHGSSLPHEGIIFTCITMPSQVISYLMDANLVSNHFGSGHGKGEEHDVGALLNIFIKELKKNILIQTPLQYWRCYGLHGR